MTEIEKMKQYIERTNMNKKAVHFYPLSLSEALELKQKVRESYFYTDEVISLAFNYGKAKGYRAAKAEMKA